LLGFGVVAVLRCARVSASVPRRLIAAPLRSTRCPIRLVSSVASSPLQGATSRLDSFLRCITHVASSPRRSPSSLVVAAVPVAVCRHCHCRRCRLLVVIGLTAAAAATGLPRRPPYLAVHRRCRFGPPWRVSSFLVPAASSLHLFDVACDCCCASLECVARHPSMLCTIGCLAVAWPLPRLLMQSPSHHRSSTPHPAAESSPITVTPRHVASPSSLVSPACRHRMSACGVTPLVSRVTCAPYAARSHFAVIVVSPSP
jgi:hypothetical protein